MWDFFWTSRFYTEIDMGQGIGRDQGKDGMFKMLKVNFSTFVNESQSTLKDLISTSLNCHEKLSCFVYLR